MSYTRMVLLALVSIMAIFPSAAFAESLLVEAEGFDSHMAAGHWISSSCRRWDRPICWPMAWGKPVADAETTVDFKSTGKYRMWVRTMDWVPVNGNRPAVSK